MGWANDSISRGLRGAELSNSKPRLALQDGKKVVYLDEAPIEWLYNAVERINTRDLYTPPDKRKWCIEEINNELNRR